MYHVAEIVRDAQRDMHERYDGFPVWAAYTPFPFLYALGGQIGATMQRKAPDLVKRAAVCTRDQIADVVTSSQRSVVEFRLTTTRTGQRVFYRVKQQVETAALPSALEPVRAYAAVPALDAIEGLAQFVTSEELPELYFVAKTSMRSNAFLRHLVLPPLGAAERVVQCVVIFPSQIVFPSREEVETRTDLFLTVSTSRAQAAVEYIYSATEVLDQHWSMVQWNILGRGPYASLVPDRRAEVIRSIAMRMRQLDEPYKQFEFLATIRVQNEMLYSDVLRDHPGFRGAPLSADDIAANTSLQYELAMHDANSFPCWFYKKLEPMVGTTVDTLGTKTDIDTKSTNADDHIKWIEFPPHENRRLERRFRWYQRAKAAGDTNATSVVLVDEGRYEVCVERMAMTPVYWPALEHHVVCRSTWLYAQRNYGLAPYSASAARTLESAFTYYLAHYDAETKRHQAAEEQLRSIFYSPSPTAGARRAVLTVPLESHLVEFKGPNDMLQHRRLLAGTTPFTSKRRVYRGDPRVKADAKLLALWRRAVESDENGNALDGVDDDADIADDVDHLMLIVHGIGDALKTIDIINVVTLRSIIDCASNLRTLHRDALASSHFDTLEVKPRVEFLPIEWHSKLHLEGLDAMIRDVTLPAIPKLREFANDTILDVLFFMSPMFHQVILREVATEMNRVVSLFGARHPKWRRRPKVSIVAHSLGAIICFDVLSHQQPAVVPNAGPNAGSSVSTRKHTTESSSTDDDNEDDDGGDEADDDDSDSDSDSDSDVEDVETTKGFDAMLVNRMKRRSRSESECIRATGRLWRVRKDRRAKRRMQPRPLRRTSPSTNGSVSTSTSNSSPIAVVPQLLFEVDDLFCFGSPVGLFLNVRGQTLALDYQLPTCKRLFNIYHPYDPVAYRIEPLVNPQRANSKAAIIRTFEGRLRFQYQLKNSFRAMWQTLRRWRRDFEDHVERSVRQIGLVESVSSRTGTKSGTNGSTSIGASGSIDAGTNTDTSGPTVDDTEAVRDDHGSDSDTTERRRRASPQPVKDYDGTTIDRAVFGALCQGAPIDYTLQENEIEIANEYLFALTAHVIYWSNRDASLFVAQKMLLEPAVRVHAEEEEEDGDTNALIPNANESTAANGAARHSTELLENDPETQTASLSSSSSSSSSSCTSPPAKTTAGSAVRRRSRRRASEQQQQHVAATARFVEL